MSRIEKASKSWSSSETAEIVDSPQIALGRNYSNVIYLIPTQYALFLIIRVYDTGGKCENSSHRNAGIPMGHDPLNDRWLSVEEISRYLGVSKETVYSWIGKRNMPANRIGRMWKFKITDVDDWVRTGGAAEPDDSREVRPK